MIKPNGGEKKDKRISKKLEDNIVAYLFIAPLVIGISIFYIYPFFQNLWFSFNDVNRFNMATFTGLENYKRLVADERMLGSLGVTLKYVVLSVPLGVMISLVIAALLNANIKGKSFYRTIYYLPSVTMAVAVALVWKWIYNGDFGLLNNFLAIFGIEGRSWLTDPDTALFMVVIVGLWSAAGHKSIILLAGMQGIPKTYYEAAEIDGAGPISQFFKITIPMVTPSIFFVLITSTMAAFKVFDIIYMMVGITSPAFDETQTLIMMFYRYAFEYGEKGYAAAISMLVFLMILIVTAVQLVGQKKWVNYD